jgi:hypothetical protein
VAVRAIEALVAFQRGGGVDDEGVGFRNSSEAGGGMGEKVEVLALEGEGRLKSVVTRGEMRWRGRGEGRFECFQVILGGEGDEEVVDNYWDVSWMYRIGFDNTLERLARLGSLYSIVRRLSLDGRMGI